jgi:hypothetical protein
MMVTFLPWFIHSDSGGKMQAKITADDEERDGGFDNDHAGSMDLDKVSIGGTHDASYARDHFYRASLIERIVGFMEKFS